MILVDTSVWIDHLRRPDTALLRLMEARRIRMHPMILGELACGGMGDRAERLREWRGLPRIESLDHDEVVDWIESESLAGKGIGFLDAHILLSALCGNAKLWTRDRSLRSLATHFGAAFPEPGA
ncbi:type II toxin-antitoxin system VapC family toxin [Candidatus Palauibacter sp.]|uniref:type II toxin-antitoxin system VapC family toxin n=1 Tax=Candidatus Palauibacter sp. TaxID=3101350 RepID=UPI003C6FAD43